MVVIQSIVKYCRKFGTDEEKAEKVRKDNNNNPGSLPFSST